MGIRKKQKLYEIVIKAPPPLCKCHTKIYLVQLSFKEGLLQKSNRKMHTKDKNTEVALIYTIYIE